MDSNKYANLLKDFLSRKLPLSKLSDVINERLFELRQSPTTVTEEEDFLSGIELMICEIEDGFRTINELEEYLKTVIFPETQSLVWGSTVPISPIISTSSNRNAESATISPYSGVTDYRLQAKFV